MIFMKTKIINKILNEMKPFLKDEEFIKLDNIINNVFNDVEIINYLATLGGVVNLKSRLNWIEERLCINQSGG